MTSSNIAHKKGSSSYLPRKNWINLVGKTVRTSDNQDLGNIKSVRNEVIVVKRILLLFVDLHYYYIPFSEVQNWDDKVVLLKISRNQVEEQYSSHDPPQHNTTHNRD
jgi:hypothetical protein